MGTNDAMRPTPGRGLGARLVNLLNAVQSRLPKDAPVILVGIPDVHVPNRVRPLALPIAAAVASAVRDRRATTSRFVREERFDGPEVRTIIDAARAWHVASTAAAPVAMPRALSHCETVVATGEPLVVEDATMDPRFSESAFQELGHSWFSAGVPVHAEDGRVIGSMSLNDGPPRASDSVDIERLRGHAVQVEAVIRRATAAAGRLDPALLR